MLFKTKESRQLFFCDVGELLYGDRWKAAMSVALAVDKKTVKRWAAGTYRVPDEAFVKLIPIMDLHIKCLQNKRRKME